VTEPLEYANRASLDSSGFLTINPKVKYVDADGEMYLVSKSKLLLELQRYTDRLGKRDCWKTPLAVLVPLVLTLATTSFTRRFGMGGDVWTAIFTMLSLLDIGWLLHELKHRGPPVTPASIVERLTEKSVDVPVSPASKQFVFGGGSIKLRPYSLKKRSGSRNRRARDKSSARLSLRRCRFAYSTLPYARSSVSCSTGKRSPK
jgi:hypothetical protein